MAGRAQLPNWFSSRGIPEDWSTHHVKFSDPGSEADAIRNGTHAQWLRIVNDPRYQMQQLRRSTNWSQRFKHIGRGPRGAQSVNDPLQRDWAYQIAPAGDGSSPGTYPAKYSFDVNAAPTCSDFVVFPVSASGSATQANIVGFNNLYDGSCPSSAASGQPFAPTVKFAYFVDSGPSDVSPVLSEDGTKVAFVVFTSGSIFHVVTLGTTGNNGTAYNAPVQPCTVNGTTSCATNNAVDTSIPMSGGSPDFYSSPFVDYADDIAYVGDLNGNLHKFTGVFRGTPAEVTTGGWPFLVSVGFFGPVYDSVSQHIFAGTYNGGLICIDVSSGAPAACTTWAVSLGSYGYINDAPIVDSTAQTVFAMGLYDQPGYNYRSTLLQTDTNLANPVHVDMGYNGSAQYDGDFDNAYYNGSYSSGYMYFCGGGPNSNGVNVPILYRIGFDSSGKMNSTSDGNSYQLSTYPTNNECTPLTEVYNPTQMEDYLFLGVSQSGTPADCEGEGCIMSFELGSSFPSGPAAAYPLGGNGTLPTAIIVDNVSTGTGASQIYFSNPFNGSATQLSQNGLN